MPKFAFDDKQREYSVQTAYWLARASKLAYQKDLTAIQNEIANDWGIREFELKFFEVKDTFAFLLKTPETILIAFRGTNTLVDWLDNINLALVAGFMKDFRRLSTAFGSICIDTLEKREKTGRSG